MKETFGSVIAEARKAKGLSQRELALKVHISNATISRIENPDDDIKPDPKTIAGIAKELNLDYNYLLSLIGYVKDQPEIRSIQRAVEKMTPEQVQKMLNILSTMFDKEFEKTGSDKASFESTMPKELVNNID